VGKRNGFISDRRRVAGRRQGRIDLGSLRPHAGQDQERRHGRRGLRLLPPIPGRHRADARDEPHQLPLLDLVAPRAARGQRGRQRQGPRLLPEPRGRTARGWDPALSDPLPLGPAAGARDCGRLARARHRVPLCRLRRDRGARAGRPRLVLDDLQRAVDLHRDGLPDRHPRARPQERRRVAARQPHRQPRPGRGLSRHAGQRARGADRQRVQHVALRAGRRLAGRRRRSRALAPGAELLVRRDRASRPLSRRLPGRPARRAHGRSRSSATAAAIASARSAISIASARPSTFWASTCTREPWSRTAPGIRSA